MKHNDATLRPADPGADGDFESAKESPRFLLTWLIWYERVVVVLGVFFLGLYVSRHSPASLIVGTYLLAFTWPFLRYGIRAAQRRDFVRGVAALTTTLWLLALLVATRGPATLSAMVFPAVLPVVVALPYLSRKQVLYLAVGAIAICISIGIIAALGPFLVSTLPDALLQKIMIPIAGATSGLTLIALWQVGTALRESLGAAEATSRALKESEKLLERKVEARTSELVTKNAELEDALAESAGVDRVSQVAISALDTNRVLESLMTVFEGVYSFDGVAVMLLDDDRKYLELEHMLGPGLQRAANSDHQEARVSMEEESSAFIHAVKNDQPYFRGTISEQDIENMSPTDRAFHDIWQPTGLLICPLASQNEVTGVISFVNSRQPLSLDRAEIARVRRYLNPVAAAIQSARLYEHASEARAAAEEANQAKSQFLAMVSHEIRTPLNGVIGLTNLALADELAPLQRKYLNSALDSAENLLAIINSLLDFSKIEAGGLELENVDFQLDRVLDHLAQIAGAAAAKKELEFVMKIGDVPPLLVGDPTRLGQAILNLVSNAVKFTDAGEVLLQVDVLNFSEDTIELQVAVSDTGPGIDPEIQSLLFAPFRQADESTTRKFGGTGLGLSITKNLVELMDGQIKLESNVGEGSTFTFCVQLGISHKRRDAQSLTTKSDLRALVVDDNQSARDVMSGYLRNFAIANDVANDANEALRLVNSNHYDVILTDLRMPGIDGIDFIKTLRKNPDLSEMRIVLVTGYGGDQQRNDATNAGANAILNKPIRPSTLFDTLQMLYATHSYTAAAAPIAASNEDFAGARILIVEDNEINQEILVGLLERAGIETVTADNGQKGVEAVRDAMQSFDLVFMDIQMPIMDGFEATRTIRRDDATLPIVGVTAHALRESRAKCLDAGMNDVITKPINPDTVIFTIEKWLTQRDDGNKVVAVDDGRHSKAEDAASNRPTFDIVGIETSEGLARTGGNETVYHDLLQRFAKDHADAAMEITQACEEHRGEDAQRRAHTLKGVAGNLGVAQVQQLADEICTVLGAEDQSRLTPLLAELATVLEEITNNIAKYLLDAGSPAAPQSVSADLERIRGLIADSDAEALDYVVAVRSVLLKSYDPAAVEALVDALQDYDFELAERALQRLTA